MIPLRIAGCLSILVVMGLCAGCSPATSVPAPRATNAPISRPTAVTTAATSVMPTAEPTNILLPPITPSTVPVTIFPETIMPPSDLTPASSSALGLATPQPTLPAILLPSVNPIWPMFPTGTTWGTSLYLCPQVASNLESGLHNPSVKDSPSELKIQIGYTFAGTVHTLYDLNQIGIYAYAVLSDGQQVPGTDTPAGHICVGDSTAELTIHRISGTEPLTSTAVRICLIDRRQQPQELYCQTYWYGKRWGPAPTEP